MPLKLVCLTNFSTRLKQWRNEGLPCAGGGLNRCPNDGYGIILKNLTAVLAELCVLLGRRAQPVIPPNLYVNEHNSLGSSGNVRVVLEVLVLHFTDVIGLQPIKTRAE